MRLKSDPPWLPSEALVPVGLSSAPRLSSSNTTSSLSCYKKGSLLFVPADDLVTLRLLAPGTITYMPHAQLRLKVSLGLSSKRLFLQGHMYSAARTVIGPGHACSLGPCQAIPFL